jgi:hypothetical protein
VSLRRLAGWSAVAAAVISVVTALLFVVAVWDLVPDFGLDLVNHPGLAIRIGPDDAGLLRWAYLADMVGYYLLFTPVILALRRDDPGPISDLGAVSGLAYVFIGSIGAVLLATVSPPLIESYAGGGSVERAAAQTTFVALTEGVQHGLWQSLEVIPGAVWLLIGGVSLRRAGAGAVGGLALLIGVLALAGAAARILGLDTALLVVFIPLGGLIPAWMLLIGLRFLRPRP